MEYKDVRTTDVYEINGADIVADDILTAIKMYNAYYKDWNGRPIKITSANIKCKSALIQKK